MPKEHKYGITRKYSRVFLLSLITLGIYYLLYQYWLFKDLQLHFERAFSTEPRSFPTKNNPTTMLIFLILFPIYPLYLKYTLLHDHIETSSIHSEENCTIGEQAILSFSILCVCTLGILPLIYEIRWQRVFNSHIEAHEQSD